MNKPMLHTYICICVAWRMFESNIHLGIRTLQILPNYLFYRQYII